MKRPNELIRKWCWLSCFAVLLSACQPSFVETRDVVDPDSSLLGALIQTSDFSSEIRWVSDQIVQQSLTPVAENRQSTEYAIRTLTGVYGSEGYNIKVIQYLERHQLQVMPVSASDLTTAESMIFTEPLRFAPLFATVGRLRGGICIKEKQDLRKDSPLVCEYGASYKRFFFRLTLVSVAGLDNETLKSIINPILLRIDSRLEALDG